MKFLKVLSVAAMALVPASTSFAAIIDFGHTTLGTHTNYVEDGYLFDKVRVVDAYCNSKASQHCSAENQFRDTTMSRVSGGAFNVTGLWFKLLTTKAPITFETNRGSRTFSIGSMINGVAVEQNKGYVVDFSQDSVFRNVSFLRIVDFTLGTPGTGKGKGNLRFDNIDVAAVPLPAAGLMLAGGLGAMGLMRRRRKAAA